MAAFTPLIEDRIRRWAGSTRTSGQLEAAWRLHGESVEAAALSVLRQLRADLVLTGPAEWSVQGDYSQKYTADQLKALDADIDTLARLCGDSSASGGYSTAYLVRADSGR